jgi:hypothetical protein
VVCCRKINSTSIHLEVEGKHLVESCDVPDEFSKHLKSVHNISCPVVFPTFTSFKFLSLTPVYYSDDFKAIKRLEPSKFVEVHDVPGFIINSCTDTIVTVLKYVI